MPNGLRETYWSGFLACLVIIISLVLIGAGVVLDGQIKLLALFFGVVAFGGICCHMGYVLRGLRRK